MFRRTVTPVLIGMVIVAAVAAQSVDPALLLKPPVDSWLTYHGDYTGQRHTKLSAITPANVHQLTLAWAFQTGQNQSLKMSPVLAKRVIYLTAPDNVWAIDAAIARQLAIPHPLTTPSTSVSAGWRYKDLVYVTTPTLISSAWIARRQGEARHRDCDANGVLVDERAAGDPQPMIVGVAGDFAICRAS